MGVVVVSAELSIEIISALIAAGVSLLAILSTMVVNNRNNKITLYKDSILKFKLEWLEKVRLHLIDFARVVKTFETDEELDDVYQKTLLILNTNDAQRKKINSLAKILIEKYRENASDKKEFLEFFIEKSRIALEIEWVILRNDIAGRAAKKGYDERLLKLRKELSKDTAETTDEKTA